MAILERAVATDVYVMLPDHNRVRTSAVPLSRESETRAREAGRVPTGSKPLASRAARWVG